MAIEVSDSLVIDINRKMLEDRSSLDHCIHMVPRQLRDVNEKAYEPQVISIGPYHFGKDHLKALEEQKIRFLDMFLKRSNKNVAEIVARLKGSEKRARRCYAKSVNNLVHGNKFVEMMVFDGCFIVELLCKLFSNEDIFIFQTDQIMSRLMQDLLLVENQLPFFVLMELFSMTNYKHEKKIIEDILEIFEKFLPGKGYHPKRNQYTSNHLLALIHDNWRPSAKREKKYDENRQTSAENRKKYNENRQKKQNEEVRFPRCTMELKEVGIKLKKKKFEDEKQFNLYEISFEKNFKTSLSKSVIEIPKLKIVDETERIMRNLMAYEQLNPRSSLMYVTEYMIFMDSLINSEKDVEILCRKGIIENWLGDDNAVATLFNKIGDEVFCERDLYSDMQKEIHDHCGRRYNKWKANFKHKYCNSPWACFSLLAAVFLLLLTIAQTVFSVLSYIK